MLAPDGFQPLARTSPALELIGPVLAKGTGTDIVLGLRVEAKHCNARGIMHGGFLATLADAALGYAISFSTTPPTPLVTVNLSVDYIGTSTAGDWLEASVSLDKCGSRMAFARCAIYTSAANVARATGVFLVTGASPADRKK